MSSAPPAAYSVVVSAAPVGTSAAASATPTGERGKAVRACQARDVGSKGTRGRTCTVVVSRSPAAVLTLRVPDAALSGTVVRIAPSLHPAGVTGAATCPPARLANWTPPPPGAAPNPKPSITTAWPWTRIGSIAPSTKSTRGAAGGGGPIESPTHAATSSSTAGASLRAAVVPSDEPARLRQVVRQRRQLGGPVSEMFNRLELFGRRRGDRLGFLGRGLSARLRLLERLGDARRQLHDAARHFGDPLAGPRRPGGRLGDLGQVLYPVRRVLDHFAQVLADAFEQLGGAIQRP